MRAIIYERYGGPEVLELRDVDEPPLPGTGQLAVRVAAAALNPKDVLVRKGKFRWMTGLRFPQTPGYDVAGVISAVGPGVHGLNVGMPVYGMIQSWKAGAYAESVNVPAAQVAPKPPSLTMVEAAAAPLAALTALQALRDLLAVRPDQYVVINGASGGVGTFAIQVAKQLGAHVTAVCSQANAGFVRELGADAVAPYDQGPLEAPLGRAGFDALFDVFGNMPYPIARPLLHDTGRYCTTVPSPAAVARDLATRWTSRPARLVVVNSNRPDLDVIARWIDEGALRPVVDRTFALEEAADAHRYLETKRARGKVVLHVRDL